MIEQIITSGKHNIGIDPVLSIWPWEVPADLFLAGLVSGLLIISTFLTLIGKRHDYPIAVKKAPIFAPFLLLIALFFLFLDLSHKMYFWQLYTNIRWTSPMSWGAWTYLFLTPLTFIWAAIHLKTAYPNWKWPYEWMENTIEYLKQYRTGLAWAILGLSLTLSMYTGILLSAFNARPIWNSAILGPLFLTSGLTSATAFILLNCPKGSNEKKLFCTVSLISLGVQTFLIIHLIMGYLSSDLAQVKAADLFLGGEFTTSFWIMIVALGTLIPAYLHVLYLKKIKVPVIIPSILILTGGFFLRYILVEAGQISHW
ncbi:MAG: polysulfide reductase NrfD [Candidatus Marinimicrobia bacterium]|nr:polysulfide reductase NrfD [Candidatus Neomarinimicrobiota bacterium]